MSKQNIEGTPATEEEVAKGLGFATVEEFRRWDTETGRKAAEAEFAKAEAKREADRFRWAGRRMEVVLIKTEEFLTEIRRLVQGDAEKLDRLLLGIRVVRGQAVDWENSLNDWLFPSGKQLEGEPNVIEQNKKFHAALLGMWEWQKTQQGFVPDELSDSIRTLLDIK